MLAGIIPILFTPFDDGGAIDADGLRRITRFELEGGAHGIGINGFASEAYKLTDSERLQNVEIVAGELAGQLPLVIGIAAGSTEAAINQMRELTRFQPSAYMVLPPATMDNGAAALVEFYVALGQAGDTPPSSCSKRRISPSIAIPSSPSPTWLGSPSAAPMCVITNWRDPDPPTKCASWRPCCRLPARCLAAAAASRS